MCLVFKKNHNEMFPSNKMIRNIETVITRSKIVRGKY